MHHQESRLRLVGSWVPFFRLAFTGSGDDLDIPDLAAKLLLPKLPQS